MELASEASRVTCDQALLFLLVREGLEMSLSLLFRQTPLQSLADQEEKKGLIAGYKSGGGHGGGGLVT